MGPRRNFPNTAKLLKSDQFRQKKSFLGKRGFVKSKVTGRENLIVDKYYFIPSEIVSRTY